MIYNFVESKIGSKIISKDEAIVSFRFKLENDYSDEEFIRSLDNVNFGENYEDVIIRDSYDFTTVLLKNALFEVNKLEKRKDGDFLYVDFTIKGLKNKNYSELFNELNKYEFIPRSIGEKITEKEYRVYKMFSVDYYRKII